MKCVKHGHLAQVEVQDVEDDVQGELGREQGEEPLGGKHVDLQSHVHEVAVQVTHLLLLDTQTLTVSWTALLLHQHKGPISSSLTVSYTALLLHPHKGPISSSLTVSYTALLLHPHEGSISSSLTVSCTALLLHLHKGSISSSKAPPPDSL